MKKILNHSPAFLRRRKMLLVLPLLVMPFVVVSFVALGGGKGQTGDHRDANLLHGYNMTLPEAHFEKKENLLDKLGFYEKADEDSIRRMERIKQDPYHLRPAGLFDTKARTSNGLTAIGGPGGSGDHFMKELNPPPIDPHADELLKKLEDLKKTIRQPAATPGSQGGYSKTADVPGLPYPIPDQSKLEKLLGSMHPTDTAAAADPQMEKLNGMLDKIIRIQHPGAGPLPEDSSSVAPEQVTRELQRKKEGAGLDDLSQGDTGSDTAILQGEAFYSIDDTGIPEEVQGNMIAVVVPGDQTLVAGGELELRLLQDAVIDGVDIPGATLLYGQVSISGERMKVSINSIRSRNSVYPVALQVYDLDGQAGIRVPGAIARDVLKESADQGIGSMGLSTVDPSVGAQAATAGIQAARTLFSRKVRLLRVSVPAGYRVFLKNTKSLH